MSAELTITQTAPGARRTLRRRSGTSYFTTIGREWRVELDGHLLGFVRYEMVEHERRTEGRRYVDDRWESPGWTYTVGGGFGRLHAATKADAIRCLERYAEVQS